MKLALKKECPTCSGTGRNELDSSGVSNEDVLHSMYACPTCDGYGELYASEDDEFYNDEN